MKNGKRKVLEQKEITRLLRELRDQKSAFRDYFAIRLMPSTGLWVSELVNLDVRDIQGLKTIAVCGKGDRVRTVPVSQTMQRHVEDFLRWKRRQGQSFLPLMPRFWCPRSTEGYLSGLSNGCQVRAREGQGQCAASETCEATICVSPVDNLGQDLIVGDREPCPRLMANVLDCPVFKPYFPNLGQKTARHRSRNQA